MKRLFTIVISGVIAAMLLTGSAPAESLLGLDDAAALLGNSTAGTVFGEGEVYTTEDGSTELGMVYETKLYGEVVKVYALDGGDGTIDAVSVWLHSGDDGVETWLDRVAEYTGTEMQALPESEASGMLSWSCRADGLVYTMRLIDDVLTLSINEAVGELH